MRNTDRLLQLVSSFHTIKWAKNIMPTSYFCKNYRIEDIIKEDHKLVSSTNCLLKYSHPWTYFMKAIPDLSGLGFFFGGVGGGVLVSLSVEGNQNASPTNITLWHKEIYFDVKAIKLRKKKKTLPIFCLKGGRHKFSFCQRHSCQRRGGTRGTCEQTILR